MTPRSPTYEEIKNNATVEIDGEKWTACWYPQMGGYIAKAWASLSCPEQGQASCFEVLVYHDGQFPFDEDTRDAPSAPAHLHHCAPEQFIEFGNFLKGLAKK